MAAWGCGDCTRFPLVNALQRLFERRTVYEKGPSSGRTEPYEPPLELRQEEIASILDDNETIESALTRLLEQQQQQEAEQSSSVEELHNKDEGALGGPACTSSCAETDTAGGRSSGDTTEGDDEPETSADLEAVRATADISTVAVEHLEKLREVASFCSEWDAKVKQLRVLRPYGDASLEEAIANAAAAKERMEDCRRKALHAVRETAAATKKNPLSSDEEREVADGLVGVIEGMDFGNEASLDPIFKLGCDVQLQGLQGKKELNGQCGRVVGFHASKQRYSVQLSGDGDPILVKETNLYAALGA
mmetsp:Transcript_62676/g.149518  ORF Transcript_62676/g.149518 Transcript_62676/m.149518 type:complete len:305 (+) Transcript_62676:102-1016(+)